MSPEASVFDLMAHVRDFLSNRTFQRHDLVAFHHANACAAADVLEDAEHAVTAFAPTGDRATLGLDYLQIYGVLQAAFLQQDSTRMLRAACGMVDANFPPKMLEIRELRNRVAGHPSATPSARAKSPPPATFLGQYSVPSGRLAIMQINAQGVITHSTAHLGEMLAGHRMALVEWLAELIEHLRRAERVARDAITEKGDVAALLHPSWSYMLSKCHEAADHEAVERATWALAGIQSLLGMLDDLAKGLTERGLEPIEEWHTRTARRALERLGQLLEWRKEGRDVGLDIAAFAQLAEYHFAHIAQCLAGWDARLRERP